MEVNLSSLLSLSILTSYKVCSFGDVYGEFYPTKRYQMDQEFVGHKDLVGMDSGREPFNILKGGTLLFPLNLVRSFYTFYITPLTSFQ